MDDTTLTAALEREHDEIDAGLEAFAAGLAEGGGDTSHLERAATALRRHIYLEEEFLFPPLRASGMLAPVLVMLREHGEIWRTLDGLEQEVRDTPTASDLTGDLLTLLEEHNAKEEPIIYPEGDARLPDDVKTRLHEFIREGSMPEGWVPAMADR